MPRTPPKPLSNKELAGLTAAQFQAHAAIFKHDLATQTAEIDKKIANGNDYIVAKVKDYLFGFAGFQVILMIIEHFWM